MSLALTGATGSYPARLWRQCVMAAALSFASDALAQSATAVRHLASPALAVKAGRQRGPSVLDKRRQEQQQEMAAARANCCTVPAASISPVTWCSHSRDGTQGRQHVTLPVAGIVAGYGIYKKRQYSRLLGRAQLQSSTFPIFHDLPLGPSMHSNACVIVSPPRTHGRAQDWLVRVAQRPVRTLRGRL